MAGTGAGGSRWLRRDGGRRWRCPWWPELQQFCMEVLRRGGSAVSGELTVEGAVVVEIRVRVFGR